MLRFNWLTDLFIYLFIYLFVDCLTDRGWRQLRLLLLSPLPSSLGVFFQIHLKQRQPCRGASHRQIEPMMTIIIIIIYTVSGKKRPQYSRHNFDKFSHSSVIFGKNHHIPQCIKTLENLSQRFKVVTWRWRHIWRHQKCRLQTKTDI